MTDIVEKSSKDTFRFIWLIDRGGPMNICRKTVSLSCLTVENVFHASLLYSICVYEQSQMILPYSISFSISWYNIHSTVSLVLVSFKQSYESQQTTTFLKRELTVRLRSSCRGMRNWHWVWRDKQTKRSTKTQHDKVNFPLSQHW